MLWNDTLDLADTLKIKSLEFLSKSHLAATPINYSVAYVHMSRRNDALEEAMLSRQKQRGKIEPLFFEELFFQHVLQVDPLDQEIIERFGLLVDDLTKNLTEQGQSDATYIKELNQIGKRLTQESDALSIKKAIGDAATLTKDTTSVHESLVSKLITAMDEINELKTSLEKTKRDALTDPLTGLLNRRGLSQQLSAPKQTNDTTVLIIDIDLFKKLNDNYGHALGDKVIQRVAKEIQNNVPGRDIAARYGGEEFLVLLIDTTIDGATKVAENIRHNIAELQLIVRHSKEPLPPITVSIGIASCCENESWEVLFERADHALYHAKKTGRNRSVTSLIGGGFGS